MMECGCILLRPQTVSPQVINNKKNKNNIAVLVGDEHLFGSRDERQYHGQLFEERQEDGDFFA